MCDIQQTVADLLVVAPSDELREVDDIERSCPLEHNILQEAEVRLNKVVGVVAPCQQPTSEAQCPPLFSIHQGCQVRPEVGVPL